MIAFKMISGVTAHFMVRLPEWGNTLTLMLFGYTLLSPGDTFDNTSFSVMAHYASENTWGAGILAIGTLRMIALVLNGTFAWFAPWSVRIRAATSTLCCFAWFCIALSLYLANHSSTGAKTYGMHLIVDIILAIYLGGQAGKVDRGIWNGRT